MDANQHFSLHHAFFDAWLDRLSSVSAPDVLTKKHSLNSQQNYYQPDAQVLFGGKIYTQFSPQLDTSEAMLIYKGHICALGSLMEIKQLLNNQGISASFSELKPNEVIVPSFIESHCALINAALLKQWFHFGPFGFHTEWLIEMPNYNINYIARAALYLDKSLNAGEWLLGYGLDSSKILCAQETIQDVLLTLQVPRPIVILDSHKALAYVNRSAMVAIYKALPYSIKEHSLGQEQFISQIEAQGGVIDEQLLWVINALPEHTIHQHVTNLLQSLDSILTLACDSGVANIISTDNHPFSLQLIEYYKQHFSQLLITTKTECEHKTSDCRACISAGLINQPDGSACQDVSFNLGVYRGVQTQDDLLSQLQTSNTHSWCSDYPFEPLSPLRVAFHLSEFGVDNGLQTKSSRVGAFAAITQSKHVFGSDGGLHKKGLANYVVLSEDPFSDKCKDLREVKVLKRVYQAPLIAH